MLEDPGAELVLEPGGFEPYERFASRLDEAEEDAEPDGFDPFMFNL